MTSPAISVVVPGPTELAEAAASWTGERITGALATRGVCYLALAGGETPRGCYERLARPPYRDALPWGRVHWFWGDERLVPWDHPDSNYGMVRQAMTTPCGQVSGRRLGRQARCRPVLSEIR